MEYVPLGTVLYSQMCRPQVFLNQLTLICCESKVIFHELKLISIQGFTQMIFPKSLPCKQTSWMQRRKFIAQSALATLGLCMSSPLLAQIRNSKSRSTNSPVIIIGAGAAGLYAGYLLHLANVPFKILEASDRLGGRMGKLESFADFPIDLGAQWLHGKKTLLKPIIKKSKTKISKDRSDAYYWFNQQFTQDLPINLHKKLKVHEDTPDVSFKTYAQQNGFYQNYEYIIEQITGDQGADADDLSIKWNAYEERNWSAGNKDYKFRKTFFDLINDEIAQPIVQHIELNSVVKSINYESDQVSVVDANGNQHSADRVIITTPITVLKDGDISFTPPLPKNKTDAFQKIGMGPGLKVFLKFKEKFYYPGFAGGKICAAYADELEGKVGEDHVLLAFVMGHQAQHLSRLNSNEAIAQALLEELDLMYNGKASKNFIKAKIINWTTHPYIRGAYSYSKVGIGNARSIAALPINHQLFFAGEAMNTDGHHQTVHGAMETAQNVVQQILAL